MTDNTSRSNEVAASADIAQPVGQTKRRGKKPSGIVKNNVCVRLTDDTKAYLLGVGKGSTSRGVDALIDWHQKATAQEAEGSAAAQVA